jgi:hypothetical protein
MSHPITSNKRLFCQNYQTNFRRLIFLTFCFSLLLVTIVDLRAQTFSNTGFVGENVTTLPPYKPVGLTFAPDGRMFIWQENGIVRIYKNGALLTTPFLNIQFHVNTFTDRGLLGFALDPNFASNGYV